MQFTAAINFFTQTWRAHAHPWRWVAAILVSSSATAMSIAAPASAPESDFSSAAVADTSDRSAGSEMVGARESSAVPAPTPAAAAVPVVATKPVLPVGKGMWLHRFEDAAGGDPHALVDWAKQIGLTHVYLRLGSSKKDFYAQGDLERLLPVAHANGIKVVGWDFPYLDDPEADARRSHAEITYTTTSGHRIDAFAADIETPAEGTNLTEQRASHYADRLRQLVGPDYPLIAAVPRYNPSRAFPYGVLAHHFDAFAPMVYWINRDPASDVAGTLDALSVLGKPIMPVGQAYDPAIDGNPQWGPPGRAQIDAFMKTAADSGVASVSFWAWNTASAEQWATIQADRSFELTSADPKTRTTALQRVLTGLGHPAPLSGAFDLPTTAALTQFQARVGLRTTGQLDDHTLRTLTAPKPLN